VVPPVVDAGTEPADGSVAGGFEWDLPSGFPRPVVPEDNPMTPEKVELGRHVFYDKRLSDNQTFACANCHKQELAFADERAVGFGSTGEKHTRGAMSLANVAYSPTLTWANPLQTALERQAQVPIFGDDPIELGMKSIDEVESRFRAVPRYHELFAAAFPDDAEPITMTNLLKALAAFERTLLSGNSPYDKYVAGDDSALSEAAKRGMVFVTTNEDHRFECNHCHGGFNFSDHVVWEGLEQAGEEPPFHQTGLYDLDGKGLYPEPNTGVYNTSLNPDDMGKFKAPTLRNIALTPPYMHDGSIATLSDVLDHYAKGGRAHNGTHTDPLLKPFAITAQEKADILAFLESLTDSEFTSNPAFSNPWPNEADALQP
jgi:cytochrome c peroxidase